MRSLKMIIFRMLNYAGIYLYCFFRLLLTGPAPCRFYPSCGSYTIKQLKEKPFLAAVQAIFKQVWHCSPWGSN